MSKSKNTICSRKQEAAHRTVGTPEFATEQKNVALVFIMPWRSWRHDSVVPRRIQKHFKYTTQSTQMYTDVHRCTQVHRCRESYNCTVAVHSCCSFLFYPHLSLSLCVCLVMSYANCGHHCGHHWMAALTTSGFKPQALDGHLCLQFRGA